MLDYEMKLDLMRKELDIEIDKVALAVGRVRYVLAAWNEISPAGSWKAGHCLTALNLVQDELKTTLTRLIHIRYK